MSAMLEMKQVTKTYGDGDATLTVLKNLELSVRGGEFVAVLGPSGSGKSTFLSAAGALLTPTSGEICIDGESLQGKSPQELTGLRLRRIGFMFQSAQLLPYLKVEEQLLYVAKQAKLGGREASGRAAMLLQRLGLWERRGHYPEQLSGGEKQRVAIARAWMNKPAILLADEPTASLDLDRGREVVRMIAEEVHSEGKAAVMVTHDERMLEWCDRVLHLENGVLVGR
ncbi:ABC transporter ATP-binding protein ['Paenibacillus yunnanensis' Narsing Rao et al. 2020]|uniref:ABC transporter ATP-binding protein n=1 Tax=Paenibacillus tengchongensis TaxID=2608684 RepID=UPI00124EE399|nr:ABC transporter ATP-binding protein [Paenibacillus tengchongensis]